MISIYQILFHGLILEEATQKMPEICTNNYFTIYEANFSLGNPVFHKKEQLPYKSLYVLYVQYFKNIVHSTKQCSKQTA